MFGGRKQGFCFLNWQRAKDLLKLEFDTEDQVLFEFILGNFNIIIMKNLMSEKNIHNETLNV